MKNNFETNAENISTVSVALAAYNGEKYIDAQLASFASQSRQPDEVVVCDDGSTDTTLALCERFRETAPFRVEIFRNAKNLGVKKNFEHALRKCSGDIIFLSDQDDVWFPNKLETITGLLESHRETLAITNSAIICDGDLNPSGFTTFQQNKAVGRRETAVIGGCCTALRREFLDVALPIPDAAAAHDNWLNGLANLIAVRRMCPQPLQYYRRHGGNESQDISTRLGRLSSLTLLTHYGLRDVRPGWRDAITEFQAYVDRLRATEPTIRALNPSLDLRAVVNGLLSRIDAIHSRLATAEKPRWKRVAPVLLNYASGKYSHFRGIKSAIKDVIRP